VVFFILVLRSLYMLYHFWVALNLLSAALWLLHQCLCLYGKKILFILTTSIKSIALCLPYVIFLALLGIFFIMNHCGVASVCLYFLPLCIVVFVNLFIFMIEHSKCVNSILFLDFLLDHKLDLDCLLITLENVLYDLAFNALLIVDYFK
jgi:hypothetical protein